MIEFSILGQSTSILELIAALAGVAGVYLTIRQTVWCFPVGIINVVLYAVLFFSPGIQLYADALLQCIYVVLLVYGWFKWTTKSEQKATTPVRIHSTTGLKLFIITAICTCMLALFLQSNTNASFPWIDSALTCSSLAAQWMIAKKYIENWILWIVIDFCYLPLYSLKHLPFTVILYAVFLLLAVKGYRDWKLTMSNGK
jgi:nicotinamide mononucleotide transporter